LSFSVEDEEEEEDMLSLGVCGERVSVPRRVARLMSLVVLPVVVKSASSSRLSVRLSPVEEFYWVRRYRAWRTPGSLFCLVEEKWLALDYLCILMVRIIG
jgi:hypothetical protein